MKRIKFLHFGDIHLDSPFTSLNHEVNLSELRREDIKDTLKKIINIAENEKVEAVFICGDLFEHNYIKKSTINFINNAFKEISAIKVFIICGNHDPNLVNSFYNNFNWSENVKILRDSKPYYLDDMGNVAIYGLGFNNFYEEKNLLNNIHNINSKIINILLTHGTIDMNFGKYKYNNMDSKELLELGMDYIGLGHFHNRIDDMGGGNTIFNPGSPEPLGFDETGEHGVYVGELFKEENGSKKLDIRFIKTNKRTYKKIDIDISEYSSLKQVETFLEDKFDEYNTKDYLINISLKGYKNRGFLDGVESLLKNIKSKFCYVEIEDNIMAINNIEEIMEETGVRGVFAKKMYKLIEDSKDNKERKELIKAFYYGIEALNTGKLEIWS